MLAWTILLRTMAYTCRVATRTTVKVKQWSMLSKLYFTLCRQFQKFHGWRILVKQFEQRHVPPSHEQFRQSVCATASHVQRRGECQRGQFTNYRRLVLPSINSFFKFFFFRIRNFAVRNTEEESNNLSNMFKRIHQKIETYSSLPYPFQRLPPQVFVCLLWETVHHSRLVQASCTQLSTQALSEHVWSDWFVQFAHRQSGRLLLTVFL